MSTTPNINMYLSNHPVSCRYGAPMGARNQVDNLDEAPLWLQRISFIDGDYAPDGTYWGGGVSSGTLWCAFNLQSQTFIYVRGCDRAVAADEVLRDYPTARFFRRP